MKTYKGIEIPDGKKVGKNKGVMKKIKARKRLQATVRADRREFAIEALTHFPPFEAKDAKYFSTDHLRKVQAVLELHSDMSSIAVLNMDDGYLDDLILQKMT